MASLPLRRISEISAPCSARRVRAARRSTPPFPASLFPDCVQTSSDSEHSSIRCLLNRTRCSVSLVAVQPGTEEATMLDNVAAIYSTAYFAAQMGMLIGFSTVRLSDILVGFDRAVA